MAKSVRKITLSQSRDIPFNRLVLSQSNVRRIKAGVSIEELAQDIARRTLLQSLTVRPVLDDGGAETGMFEIPAGGRRYRALELLVKQKLLSRNAPVPCVIRTDGLAEEDSLAENIQRVPLEPLDQFRAFRDLVEKGRTEEEVAAAFFVSVSVVKQRLRLAAVSPALLDVYAEDGMSLDQLMAFAVNPDHERQQQVWQAVQRSHNKEPYYIRRLLTEGAVRASDKRAQFVGIEAYEAAGGDIIRDLFQQDDGGWLQEPMLLDRLVDEKLEREAGNIRSEGWKWVEVAVDFPYGHIYGLRRIAGEAVAMTDEEVAAAEALHAEYERLEQDHSEIDVLPEGGDQRLGEIETALDELDERPVQYDPDEIARAGAFVSIDASGALRVERGYVRPEDEPAIPQAEGEAEAEQSATPAATSASGDTTEGQTCTSANTEAPDQEEGIKPIPDRLMTELTAYRTLALRDALAGDPDVAFLAALHALCLKLFYRYTPESCLDVDAKSVVFGSQAPGLGDATIAKAVDQRHRQWSAQLPRESAELWDALTSFDRDSRDALFAHCIALSVNAVYEPSNRRPRALDHADRLAEAIGLDIAAAGWSPTVDNYFGRVTKARILQAVREVKGETAAQLIEHLKKGEMAERAEELLTGSGWLPEPLRTPGRPSSATSSSPESGPISPPLRGRTRQ
ncbi:ParB/RepB/Spo0J family partition protein [Rhodopseudomonas boonkerdii]|jgi:ParB family chromosome partitioning protein|uniref:ParB/RepB/Spo0J family partition protein n=1 Tax=Hyphomicrobiales TaxID=356 RepID=UPI00124F748C|nr:MULTISPECIES: ParB/RepB/Spo0J family partition protein [Hyphomicrobiales]KAB2760775.1 ParB/RepB/Spo0J family partition protein [Brucella anthropi]MCX7320833.1 ParB/RepB/Spo0J family partition protein [Hyphomicrobiales bacterium]UGV29204.1 ParB/RepB/Spo0J family partition protein [Rhodopseudomonas boonkerdii]